MKVDLTKPLREFSTLYEVLPDLKFSNVKDITAKDQRQFDADKKALSVSDLCAKYFPTFSLNPKVLPKVPKIVTKRSTEKRVGEYVVAIWQSDSEFSITYRDLKNNGTIFCVSDGVLKFQDLEDQKVFEVVATVGSDWDADVTKKEYIEKLTKQGKLQVIIPD